MDHLMKLDEMVMNMSAIGDPLTDDEILVILLGSLTDIFLPIIRIIENVASIDLLCAKEILQREWEDIRQIDSEEMALNASKMKVNY